MLPSLSALSLQRATPIDADLPYDLVRKILSDDRLVVVERFDVKFVAFQIGGVSKNQFKFNITFNREFNSPGIGRALGTRVSLKDALKAKFGDRWDVNYPLVTEGRPIQSMYDPQPGRAYGNYQLTVLLGRPKSANPVMDAMSIMDEIWSTVEPYVVTAVHKQNPRHKGPPNFDLQLLKPVTGGPEKYTTQIVQLSRDPNYGRKVVMLSKADPGGESGDSEEEEYYSAEEEE